jgi:hypothetical protein
MENRTLGRRTVAHPGGLPTAARTLGQISEGNQGLACREEISLSHTYVTSGEGVPPSVAPFSAAVVAGDICFISGQPAIDPESGQFRGGTIEEEFVVAFGNVLAIAVRSSD